MSTEEWTQLVQRVDHLITELRAARAEANRWRTRVSELERLHLQDERTLTADDQTKDRELDRLRRERKKIITIIEKIVMDIEKAQSGVVENP
jgi:chromosome segregation ATPase